MQKFSSTTQIIQTDDFAEAIIEICREELNVKVGVIIDECLVNNTRINRLVQGIQRGGSAVQIHVAPAGEPTTDNVDQVAAAFRGCPPDCIIGVGGGSTLDLAKAVSVMVVNDGLVADYHGTGKPISKATRKIMVPTTAGTGSEVTPGAVLVNKNTLFKRALAGRWVCPDYAVLDASLTVTMPETITITTGMDAIAHAVESYTARCANTVTRMYSVKAFQLLVNNLPRVLEKPDNLEYRRNTMLGSCLAGFAIFNSNTGAAHAMAYPMGIYHNVPHGVAVANLISEVVSRNISKGCLMYSDLLDYIEGVDKGGSPYDRSIRFGNYIKMYHPLRKLMVKLEKYGISESNIEHLAERGLDLASALNNNPVRFDKTDAVSVLCNILRKPVVSY
jgi:alcohol dehydrogenase class IV